MLVPGARPGESPTRQLAMQAGSSALPRALIGGVGADCSCSRWPAAMDSFPAVVAQALSPHSGRDGNNCHALGTTVDAPVLGGSRKFSHGRAGLARSHDGW